MSTTRREFFDRLLATTGALAVPAPLWAQAGRRGSPNDLIRVGVIGVRGRGRAHISAFKKMDGVEVAAICDADSGVVDIAQKSVPDAKYVEDLRKLLEDDSIDVISIATPNHWHSLASIWALQAGKHVYVEKPLSHDVHEGRVLVQAAARSGKVVQHGTQARSMQATREAIEFLQSGGLGKVRFARALCYKRRGTIGKVDGPQTPPDTCDYQLWSGPAGMQPLRRKNLHYDWHWDYSTGNGDLGNQGVHQMDIARWGLGLDRLPKHVMSVGGRVGYDDDGNTPNTQIALYDYDDVQLMFEVRGLKTSAYQIPGGKGASIGVVFECDDGYLVSGSYTKVQAFDRDGNVVKTFQGAGNHFQQFIDAVRAEDPSMVNASPLEGHLSSALCHLGNVSYRCGSKSPVSGVEDAFAAFPNGAGVELGAESLAVCMEHMKTNGVDLETEQGLRGPLLHFDHESERFTGDAAQIANSFLRKSSVEGFTVPDRG